MKGKKIVNFLYAMLSVLLVLALIGCGGTAAPSVPEAGEAEAGAVEVAEGFDEYITFGHNHELTGAFPIIGESSIQGIDMAVNEINAAGGVMVGGKAYGLAYKALDNGFNTDQSAINAQQFADDEEIVAMIGPNDSDMCMATQAIVTQEEIVSITPWSTLVVLTDSPWYFRVCFDDTFQGEILAKYAYNYEDAKTAAVLYDMSNPYNEGISRRFIEVYKELGGTIVEDLSYNGKTGETDFTSQLTKIASAQPDILLLPNFYEEIIAQTTQARDMGYTGKFMGSDTWGDTSLLDWDTENLLEGALWVGHYHKDVASDIALEFIKNYHEIYGTEKDPNDIVALNYDAVYLLKTAIEKADSFERSAIRDGLNAIDVFVGVTGTGDYTNGTGTPVKSAVIMKIHDGRFDYLDTIQP